MNSSYIFRGFSFRFFPSISFYFSCHVDLTLPGFLPLLDFTLSLFAAILFCCSDFLLINCLILVSPGIENHSRWDFLRFSRILSALIFRLLYSRPIKNISFSSFSYIWDIWLAINISTFLSSCPARYKWFHIKILYCGNNII